MFSGCPSVRPSEAWNTLFFPVHRPVGPPDQPWPFYGMSVCPSVRPDSFPGFCCRTLGGNDLKFYMLMYLDRLQIWLVYGYGLLIFLIWALFWLSGACQIWGFRAFPGERIEGLAWNMVCCCILTTFRTDKIMIAVWWFCEFWYCVDLVKLVKFGVSGNFQENPLRKWPEMLHAGVSGPPLELIRWW